MITDAILEINPNAKVTVIGDDKDINSNQIIWHEGTTPIPIADIEAKMAELPTPEEEATARENLKASAKAKLIAGEPLTEEEANTIVL